MGSIGDEVGGKDLHPAEELVEEIRSQAGAGRADKGEGSWQRPEKFRTGPDARCCWRSLCSSPRLGSFLS